MNNRQIQVRSIVEWHMRTFPKMTKSRQILKLIEEFFEWTFSLWSIKELADIYIVLVVWQYRFRCKFAAKLCNKLYSRKLYYAVKTKMIENNERQWNKKRLGHHV